MNGSQLEELGRMVLTPLDMLNWLRVKDTAKIGDNEWAVLCSGHIGETYLTCGLVEAFRKSHGNAPVVVVTTSSYAPIADLFPAISRVAVIDGLPAPFTSDLMKTLYKPRRGTLISAFGPYCYNYKGVNFLDSFKMALDLSPDAKFSRPRSANKFEMDDAQTLLKENGLRIGKTAILFPSARSTKSLPDGAWIRISAALKKKGWDVATNVVGDMKEIEGTIGLKISIKQAHAVVKSAGWMIALRSGICDLLSSAECKKTVLYPKYDEYYHVGEFKTDINRFRKLSDLGLPNIQNLKEFDINPQISDREVKLIIA